MVALKIDMVVQNVEEKKHVGVSFLALYLRCRRTWTPLKTFLIQVKETCIFSP